MLRRYGWPSKIALYALATIISLAFLAPFLWIIVTSLKPDAEIYSIPPTVLPQHFTFEQYVGIFTRAPQLLLYFGNSLIVTLVSVLVVVVLAALAAFAYGRFDFFGKRASFAFLLLVMFVPWIVFLVPIYILEDIIQIVNSRLGLILPYIALNLPLGIFILRGHFVGIPREVEEAARMDGCNLLQLWWSIMLPMVRPGLATVAILTSIAVWEEFLFAKTIVTSQRVWTIPVGITMLQQEAQSWAFGILSAAIIMSLIPLLALFLVFQRQFISGIADGAIKG